MVTALKISQYVNIVVGRYCFVSGAVFQNIQTVSIIVIDQLVGIHIMAGCLVK